MVLATINEPYDDGNYSCLTKYRTIACEGCKHIQFQTEFTDSVDIEEGYDEAGEPYSEPIKKVRYFPPRPTRPRPEWIEYEKAFSGTLAHILGEAYDALDNNLPVLSAIAIRTAFDASTEVLGIHPSLRFEEKLDALEAAGHIDGSQRKVLNALTDAGSAAAHRGWLPNGGELDTIVHHP